MRVRRSGSLAKVGGACFLLWLNGLCVLHVRADSWTNDTGYKSAASLGPHVDWQNADLIYTNDGNFGFANRPKNLVDLGTFGFAIPDGATIEGIEIIIDWSAHKNDRTELGAELSWDQGLSYTLSGYSDTRETDVYSYTILGGPHDKWGRVGWSHGDFSDRNFRVRFEAIDTTAHPRVDWLGVKVYYSVVFPSVHNDGGATNVTVTAATLRGGVTAGMPVPDAYIYWGPSNGSTNKASWSNVVEMGLQGGVFTTNIPGLVGNNTYYYRCYVTNAAGEAWAVSTTNFATPSPTVSFVGAPYSVAEDGGSQTVTLALSAESALDISVDYATSNGTAAAGSDYTNTTGRLTWLAGETGTKSFSVPIRDDTDDESDETFSIVLSNGVNCLIGVSNATVIIEDNDGGSTIRFQRLASAGLESITLTNIIVSLSPTSAVNVTVDYNVIGGTATNGVDFYLASGTATVNVGNTSARIALSVINDKLDEANETIVVGLSNPNGGNLGIATNHTYTIIDDDCSPPAVNNGPGAGNISAVSATLRGEITDNGGENPLVIIYWGPTNGETNKAAWSNSVPVGTVGLGGFATNILGLSSNTLYYYRCCASNSGGLAWADFSEKFVAMDPPEVPLLVNEGLEDQGATPQDAQYWTRSDTANMQRAAKPITGSWAMDYTIQTNMYLYGSLNNDFRISWNGLYSGGGTHPYGGVRPGFVLSGQVSLQADKVQDHRSQFTYRWRNIDEGSDWMSAALFIDEDDSIRTRSISNENPVAQADAGERVRPELRRDPLLTGEGAFVADDLLVSASLPRLVLERDNPTQTVYYADTVVGSSTNMKFGARCQGGGPGTILYGAYITGISDLTNASWSHTAWYEFSDPSNAFSIVSGATLVAANDTGFQYATIEFVPPSEGTFTAVVHIATTDPVDHYPGGAYIQNTIVYEEYTLVGTGLSAPEIGVGPTNLEFAATLGSAPAEQTFTVTNLGAGTLFYTNTITYGNGSGWASVAPVNGALGYHGASVHTVSVSVVTAVGNYCATNTVDGNQVNDAQKISIALTVTNVPTPYEIAATDIGTRHVTVEWTRPGYDVIVVRRQGAPPEEPENGSTYAHNATYGAGNASKVVYAAGSGSTDTDTGLTPQTVYYYGFFGENNSYYSPGAFLCVTTLTAVIDGNDEEWIGGAPAAVNSGAISSNEFIWRDKQLEERHEPPAGLESNNDMLEFRVRADTDNMYFMVRLRDMTGTNYPHVAVAVDTDRDPADTNMNWMADDANILLGDGYYTNGAAGRRCAERNLIVHEIEETGPRIEMQMDTESSWSAPPTLGGDEAAFNAADDFIEWAVARSDLGLSGTATARLTVASCHNTNAWADTSDTTAPFPTNDAVDTLSIVPYGVNDPDLGIDAFEEEISDGDGDFFFEIRLDANGLAANQLPSEPAVIFPTNNSVIEPGSFGLMWSASTDADGEVTGYFLEIAVDPDHLGANENSNIVYRLNTRHVDLHYSVWSPVPAHTQYYWRVRSRDLGGMLSRSTTRGFRVEGADDDTLGPVPTLVYIGTNYTEGAEKTTVTDGELANPADPLDIAVRWTDVSGVFLTNGPPYASTNIHAARGRVVPNWDLYTTNVSTGAEEELGYDQPFGFFRGVNRAVAVTTVCENAFSVTNITFSNLYFLALGAEDEDNDRGFWEDPQGDGDRIPHDRAVRTNYLIGFTVVDDDTNGPAYTAFNVDNAVFTNVDLASGLVVTGLIQDFQSGVFGGSSNRFELYRNGVPVTNGVFTTRPEANGSARSAPAALGVTLTLHSVGYAGSYRLVARGRDFDGDRPGEDDTAEGTAAFTFSVVDPPLFPYKLKITFDGYDKDEVLTNFPALVVLNNGLTNFSYCTFLSSSGADLRFRDADESFFLNYEIEEWNTNGNSCVWVQVPELTNGTYIWACWGLEEESAAPEYTTNGATWTEGFRSVFHLHAAGGGTAYDSTSNGVDGTLINMEDSDWTGGLIAKGLRFDGIDEFVSNSLAAAWSDTFTVSMWVKADRAAQGDGTGLFANGADGFQVDFDGGGRYRYNGTNDADLGQAETNWVYLTVTFDGVDVRTYVNGVEADTALDDHSTFSRYDIGTAANRSAFFEGMLDEVRISEAARSSNWVWASYLTQGGLLPVGYGEVMGRGTYYQVDPDPAETGVALPFIENFDTLVPGDLDGANDWHVARADAAHVQSGSAYSGANAARVGRTTVWHGFGESLATNVWIDWYARPVPRRIPPRPICELHWNTTASFYLNPDGRIVVRSNATWVVCSEAVFPTGEWLRFSLNLDYGSDTWSLHVAGSNRNELAKSVARGLPFCSCVRPRLVSFRVTEDSPAGMSYVDELGIGATMPLSVDADNDGMSDAWEVSVFGNTDVAGDIDSDGDGITNRLEYLAGTHPTNSASRMRIVSVDLKTETGNHIDVTLAGGNWNGPTTYAEAGDRIVRTYSLYAAGHDSDNPKTYAGSVTDTLSGSNKWTDANAANLYNRRYYDFGMTFAGQTVRNTEEWAAYVQDRPADQRFLMCVPVDYGSAAGNNLNSTLGRHLMRGLSAGGETNTADRIEFFTESGDWYEKGSWQKYYLFTNDSGQAFWSDGGPSEADATIKAGQAIWVIRGAGPSARGNSVFGGRSFTEHSVEDLTFGVGNDEWTMFGWPLPRSRGHSRTAAGGGQPPPANQLGFAASGTGGTTTDPGVKDEWGDRIWVWENNEWSRFYWLMDHVGADWDGRWWDNRTRDFADFSLEPGVGYYYRHVTNKWGGSEFQWTPETP